MFERYYGNALSAQWSTCDRARTGSEAPPIFASWADAMRKRQPPRCRVDDHAFGGWRCPLFLDTPGVERIGRPGCQCPPGPSCHFLLSRRRKNRSPTDLGTVGNRKPPDNRSQGSCPVWCGLTDARRALLRSQHGPLASAALFALPSSRATRNDCQPSGSSFAADSLPVSPHLPMWPPT